MGAQDMVVGAAEETGREIDVAVRELIDGGAKRAGEILQQRRADLEAGVELLIARESLSAEDFAPLRSSPTATGNPVAVGFAETRQ